MIGIGKIGFWVAWDPLSRKSAMQDYTVFCYFPVIFPIVGPLISYCFPMTENKSAHNKKLIENPEEFLGSGNKEPLGYQLGKKPRMGGGAVSLYTSYSWKSENPTL